MKKLTHSAIINSGLRGFLCAGLATSITALFSWSFVASTDGLDWMGSGRLGAPGVTVIREVTGAGPAIERA